ncbi:MAG: ABC transporter permease [Chlamydiota bacterium]
MSAYLIKKFFIFLCSLLFIASLTFFLMYAAPGDPFLQEQAIPQEVLDSMYAHYGLDQPWYMQYLRYLKGVLTWNLGPSFKYEGRTVNEIISDGFPVSFALGLEAMIISVVCGILLGVVSAVYRCRWQDHLCMILAVIGTSVPSFIKATFLQYVFGVQLGWLPIARWGTFAHSVLPAIALAALPMAFIARLTRANMVEVLEQDYVLLARSKGLSTPKVILKHVLKNTILPVITYLGPLSSTIFTGSFVIERIFGIPGLGGWFVNSITNRDYTVIMGVTVFYGSLLMTFVFLIDIAYTFLDPRIRLSRISHAGGSR